MSDDTTSRAPARPAADEQTADEPVDADAVDAEAVDAEAVEDEPVEGELVAGEVLAAAPLDPEIEEFAQQIADQIESFLIALQAIAAEADGGRAISLLLLEVSQVLLAGARLGAQMDFTPREEYQPDVGPDPDIDELRLRLATMFDGVDTHHFIFDPYLPEVIEGVLSDDLTSIAADLENGLRHYRGGDVEEALWWWQFSYVSSWGTTASATLRALQSIVTHDRLDSEVAVAVEAEQLAAADEMLGTDEPPAG